MGLPFAVKIQPENEYLICKARNSFHPALGKPTVAAAGPDEACVIKVFHPLQEKGHQGPWAPGKASAVGCRWEILRGWETRTTHPAPPSEVVQEDRDIFVAPILNHRHKSLKGSTILFSVVGNFRLLLKNKIRDIQNSQSNKAGKNSITQKHWAILRESEGERGQVSSSHNRHRETRVEFGMDTRRFRSPPKTISQPQGIISSSKTERTVRWEKGPSKERSCII